MIIQDLICPFTTILSTAGGASTDPCSETYCGPSPLSEKETQAISSYFNYIAKDVELYLSFHSYGQLLMYPYGNRQDPLPNQEAVEAVSKAAGDALLSVYGTRYDVGNAQKVLCKPKHSVLGFFLFIILYILSNLKTRHNIWRFKGLG